MTDSDDQPPHDIGAEQAALGAMLLSPLDAAKVAEILARDDFYRQAHQTLYQRITTMRRDGIPVDPETVRAELEKHREFTGDFKPPYLHDLMTACPTATNGDYYARTVARAASRRRVLETLVRAQQQAWNGTDLAELVERASYDLTTEAQLASVDDPRGRSWRSIDLGPILRGEHKPIEPAVGLVRSDGLQLLYPGKEHSVIGEMESGKSWFCLACCAAELVEGNHVLYVHFEEADPTDTVGRLLALGVSSAVIEMLFRFVGPSEPVRPELLAELLEPAPTLAVLDGVNEAMALHGHAIREEDGAAAFRRLLVKPCTAVGAAVLAADHVVKDKEARGRNALGSVHKGNAVNGSSIMLENAEPFGRGQRGRSHVFAVKDRPGHLRRAGRATKTPGKTFMGELVVDDTRTTQDHLDLMLWPPAAPSENEQGDQDPRTARDAVDDDRILGVIRALIAADQPAHKRNVRAKSGISNPRTDDALTRLEVDGQIQVAKGAKNATIFVPTKDAS